MTKLSYCVPEKLKVSYVCKGKFNDNTIERVFDFAYGMTFGGEGEHRNHRSGGSDERTEGEIFVSTFQGKLAECAVCNLIFNAFDTIVEPDFKMEERGKWDTGDVDFDHVKICVKSTKDYGQLMMLEYKDWDKNGLYKHGKKTPGKICVPVRYDLLTLVRIKPDCSKILENLNLLLANSIRYKKFYSLALKKLPPHATGDILTDEELKGYFFSRIKEKEWEYDIPRYITLKELKGYINEEQIIRKGDYLNKTKIDADNYYVILGEMHPAYVRDEGLDYIVNEDFINTFNKIRSVNMTPY